MPVIEIIDSTLKHARELSKTLREGDKKEIIAAGMEPHKGVFYSFRHSLLRKTGLIDGKVAAMWGVGGTTLGLTGHPYLLTSTEVEKILPLTFARIYKNEVLQMAKIFPILENYVHSDYHEAVRLLKLSGFSVSKPLYIKNGIFRRFTYE